MKDRFEEERKKREGRKNRNKIRLDNSTSKFAIRPRPICPVHTRTRICRHWLSS